MRPMTPTHCGLFTAADAAPIPLTSVSVEGTLVGPCAQIEVTQRYTNAETRPIEAVYVFPLDEGAAVCGFSAVIGDRRVEGRVEEREAAFEAYDDALAAGDGAFLLDQERPNIFTASIGNLPPGESCAVTIRYVTFVADEGEARRFVLPTTVSPRYVVDRGPQVGQPDGERINPERSGDADYGLSITLHVEAPEGLAEVASPSHPIRTKLTDGGAVVTLGVDEVALDRDFVCLVTTRAPREPFAVVAADAAGNRAAMVSFLPDVDALMADREAGSEVVFVLDCSGSMGGTSIDQAKRALALCLRTLETGDRFNIVRFGSTYEKFKPAAVAYGEATLREATAYLDRVDADLGGTEILAPLQAIFAAPRDGGRQRQVLLLTDGQVSNEADVIALAAANAGSARVFTFGIGAGASDHLVRGVARASRGASEFIFPGERIEPKVLRMFRRVRTPALDDVRLDWQGLDVELATTSIPPVFAGDRLTVLARVKGGHGDAVTLHAAGRSWSLPLDLERPRAADAVVTLWARERIRQLDSGEPGPGSAQRRGNREDRRREQLVALSKQYGLVSSATSFVAVDVRAAADKTVQAAQLRRVPVKLTDGWGGASAGRPQPRRRMAALGMVGGGVPAGIAPMAAPAPAPMAASAAAPAEQARRGGGGFGLGSLFDRVSGKAKKRAESAAERAPAQGLAEAGHAELLLDADFESAAEGYGGGNGLDADFYGLLMSQRADGSFAWSEALEGCLGAAHVDAARAAVHAGGDEAVAVTVLVLAVLERTFGQRRDEWAAAAAKAERWLAGQGGAAPAVRAFVATL